MKYTFNENNWYSWSYDDSAPFARRTKHGEIFKTKYDPKHSVDHTLSFKAALMHNAVSVLNTHGPRLQLLMSGGIDSELVLRVYKELNIPVTCHIFRYENDYNVYDVSHAVVACIHAGVKYYVHDFNLEKFFESEVFKLSSIAQCDRPRALVQLSFLDYFDDVPVSASSDPRWYRPSSDYTQRIEWHVQDFEHDIALDRYCAHIGRPAVMQWFKWSPELTMAWFNLKWFDDLTNDRIKGKEGVVSTKIQGYREVYPDISIREKRTGFEDVDHLVLPAQSEILRANGGAFYRQYTDRSRSELLQEMTK